MKKHVVEQMRGIDPNMNALEAGRTFDIVTDAIKQTIDRVGEVRIPGFGTFKKKRREGRVGRNPSTGESISISARDVVSFKQSKTS